MKMSTLFFYLIAVCLACSKSATTPNPVATIDGPYRVTATLNDSVWYGSAYASKTLAVAGQTACTSNRFDIGFSTDLSYDYSAPKQLVTGCTGDCIPTQSLAFHSIPMAIGRYEISDLNLCVSDGAVSYYLLVGGDVITRTYTSKGSTVGWIQVTGYNAAQQAVEGIFEVDLTDRISKTAHFKNGAFKALIH